jgi:hypothetical protein
MYLCLFYRHILKNDLDGKHIRIYAYIMNAGQFIIRNSQLIFTMVPPLPT